MNDKFDKFTERARKVLSLAQEEAQRFNHNYIGTEHLLLGLVREGDGVAAKVLTNLGVDLYTVRSTVEFMIGRGDRIVLGDIGLTPRAKKVIELAIDEARRLNHHYIGTEHLLLGLVREGEGIAAGVLKSLGVDLEQVRAETLRVLGQPVRPRPDEDQRAARSAPLQPPAQNSLMFGLGGMTSEASYVLRLAQMDAQQRQHAFLGDEHLLLGLAMEGQSHAARVLATHGAMVVAIRDALAATPAARLPEPGLTPLAQIILGQAQMIARQANAAAVTPEHLLLAVLRSPEGAATAALRHLGTDLQALATEIASDVGGDAHSS